MDLDIDPMAILIGVVFTLLLAAMMFKVTTWANYPVVNKWIILVLALPVLSFVANIQLNK